MSQTLKERGNWKKTEESSTKIENAREVKETTEQAMERVQDKSMKRREDGGIRNQKEKKL